MVNLVEFWPWLPQRRGLAPLHRPSRYLQAGLLMEGIGEHVQLPAVPCFSIVELAATFYTYTQLTRAMREAG